eukprot:Pompholyxophrys_punicea_v1_NODE_146_length_3199_cov_26.441373.p3 type:complete len:114 gc:universal NODE_146_length_3199_cov_26.441373:1982-2323(+)
MGPRPQKTQPTVTQQNKTVKPNTIHVQSEEGPEEIANLNEKIRQLNAELERMRDKEEAAKLKEEEAKLEEELNDSDREIRRRDDSEEISQSGDEIFEFHPEYVLVRIYHQLWD